MSSQNLAPLMWTTLAHYWLIGSLVRYATRPTGLDGKVLATVVDAGAVPGAARERAEARALAAAAASSSSLPSPSALALRPSWELGAAAPVHRLELYRNTLAHRETYSYPCMYM